jgi:hypothetical protein
VVGIQGVRQPVVTLSRSRSATLVITTDSDPIRYAQPPAPTHTGVVPAGTPRGPLSGRAGPASVSKVDSVPPSGQATELVTGPLGALGATPGSALVAVTDGALVAVPGGAPVAVTDGSTVAVPGGAPVADGAPGPLGGMPAPAAAI